MQTELTLIGREILKQLDQIVWGKIDISLGTDELLESFSLSDNIVASSYFFNLLQNLNTLPEFMNQPASGTEPADHEDLINPLTEGMHNQGPVKFPEPPYYDKPVDRIEFNNLNTRSKFIRPAIEDIKDPVQISGRNKSINTEPERTGGDLNNPTFTPAVDSHKSESLIDFPQRSQEFVPPALQNPFRAVEKTEFDNFSSRTENNPTGIGSFSDLAHEFLPAETICAGKQYANDTFTQPKTENLRGQVPFENELVKKISAEEQNTKDKHHGHQSQVENEKIKPDTVSGDAIIIQKNLQDNIDKPESPGSNLDSLQMDNKMRAGNMIKTTTLSSVLEKVIQQGQREEILELAKVFAKLIDNETIVRDSADFGHTILEDKPLSNFKQDMAASKTKLFPGVIETLLFEEYNQDDLLYCGYAEPIVSWIKSTKSEDKPDNSAYHELKNLRLNYRRYYGV
jgi:hypothetical protein